MLRGRDCTRAAAVFGIRGMTLASMLPLGTRRCGVRDDGRRSEHVQATSATDTEYEEEHMPSLSKKEERQYEHIKESAKSRGAGEGRAKELAARTVNKGKRQQGRTSNSRSSSRTSVQLEQSGKAELYHQAAEMKIPGRSRMNKGQLIDAIRGAGSSRRQSSTSSSRPRTASSRSGRASSGRSNVSSRGKSSRSTSSSRRSNAKR